VNPATPSVDELLQQFGISPTQQRRQIAEILFERPQHVSAEQVLGRVNQESSLVSKATVYTTLGLFARKGLIREVLVDPSRVFSDCNPWPRHHFFNVGTGQLEDIEAEQMFLQNLPTPPAGTELESVDIIVRVRTEKCSTTRSVT